MHLLEKLEKPIIFAHRGASHYAPENTMAAFSLAKAQGVPAIELDVRLSKDLVPMVIHDRSVERTTNGQGMVDQMYSNELQLLDAGLHFSRKFRGERIPKLERVLSELGTETVINIELKNYHDPKDPLPEIVSDMVEKMGLSDNILYSSFLPHNLHVISRKYSKAKVALLCPRGFMGKVFSSLLFLKKSPEFIHPHYLDLNRNYLRNQHKRNRRVHAWTVNDKDTAQQLLLMGVDGIITDYPDMLIALTNPVKY